jgi:ribonuclease P protein component
MQQKAEARFPRETRLRGRDVFGQIFRQGEGLRRGQLVLKYRAGPASGKEVHAGFVVRRSAGVIARRNRLRRLVREAYRLQRSRFEDALPDGIALDLIFLWSGSPEQALRPNFDAIGNDVGAALAALVSRMRKRVDGTEEQR